MDIEHYESTIQKWRRLVTGLALEDVEEGRMPDGKEALLKIEGEVWNMSLNWPQKQ